MSCYLLFKEPMNYLVPRGSGGHLVVVATSKSSRHLTFTKKRVSMIFMIRKHKCKGLQVYSLLLHSLIGFAII